MRVTLLANSRVGKFSLTSLEGYANPLYYLPIKTYPYDLSCTAEVVEAYTKVDRMVTLWNLFKKADLDEDIPPELVAYGFYSDLAIEDFSNALLIQRKVTKVANGKHNRSIYSNADLERIADSAMMIFRRDEFFVFGASNYSVLITATQNEAIDAALSNAI